MVPVVKELRPCSLFVGENHTQFWIIISANTVIYSREWKWDYVLKWFYFDLVIVWMPVVAFLLFSFKNTKNEDFHLLWFLNNMYLLQDALLVMTIFMSFEHLHVEVVHARTFLLHDNLVSKTCYIIVYNFKICRRLAHAHQLPVSML